MSNYVTTGQVKIVHRILGSGQESETAAEGAECASAQGLFREYYNMVYRSRAGTPPVALTRGNVEAMAANVGVKADEFGACLANHEYASKVMEEREAFSALGLEFTPTVFINGEKIVGLGEYEVYREAIEKALAEAK